LFFYYFSLITSQQNHAQARWHSLTKKPKSELKIKK
jgi:hypothetical protein